MELLLCLLLRVHCRSGQEFAVLFHRCLSTFFIFFKISDEITSMVITYGRQHLAERIANILDQGNVNKLKKSEENSVQIMVEKLSMSLQHKNNW